MEKGKTPGIIYAFVAAAVIAVAAGAFFTVGIVSIGKKAGKPSDYEIAERYVESEKAGKILEIAEKYADDNISRYESRELVAEEIRKTLGGKNLTVARSDGYTEETPEFTVFCRGDEFLSVKVRNGGISEVSVIGTDFLGKEYAVSVPHGAKLTVNGIEAETAEKTGYPLLTVFEESLSQTVYSDRYVLGRLFCEPELKAVMKGKNLVASGLEDGAVVFPYPSDVLKTAEFSVPYGSRVLVNGIEPDVSFISDGSGAYPYLTRFEEKTEGVPTATVYRIKGLFEDPDIRVTYGEETLSCKRENAYCLPDGMTKSIKITAPDYATVRINGVALGKAEITGEKIEIPILSEVTNYAKSRPYLTEYTVSGLLGDPVVTAYGEDGKQLPPDKRTSTKDAVVFGTPVSQIPQDDAVTVKTFAKNYIKYRYSGISGIASNYNNLTAMTPGKSLGYKKIKAEYKKVQNLPAYTKIEYGEPVYGDFRVYGDSYSCSVTYPFSAKLDGVTQNFELDIEILYVFSGKIRRVVNYITY